MTEGAVQREGIDKGVVLVLRAEWEAGRRRSELSI